MWNRKIASEKADSGRPCGCTVGFKWVQQFWPDVIEPLTVFTRCSWRFKMISCRHPHQPSLEEAMRTVAVKVAVKKFPRHVWIICILFPTCQVRVVRFYVSCLLLSSSPLLLLLNRDPRRTVFSVGPQPRPSTPSVPCRTSTTTIPAQCSLPDLNHDHPRPVFPAGPHVGRYGTKNVQKKVRKNVRQDMGQRMCPLTCLYPVWQTDMHNDLPGETNDWDS